MSVCAKLYTDHLLTSDSIITHETAIIIVGDATRKIINISSYQHHAAYKGIALVYSYYLNSTMMNTFIKRDFIVDNRTGSLKHKMAMHPNEIMLI